MKTRRANLILIVLFLLAAAVTGGLYYLIHVRGANDTGTDQSTGSLPLPAEETPSGDDTPVDTFFISFIGDCTLASDQYDNSFQKTIDEKGVAWPFSDTKDILSSDELTIANLENTFSDSSYSSAALYYYCGPVKNAEILSSGGVDCVVMGNDHTNDFGEKGVQDTQKALDSADVNWVDQEDAKIFETRSGLKIGIFCPGWTGLNETSIVNGISELQSAGADLCIFAPHWGNEGSSVVTENQETFAHMAVDAGAQIVYGTHPQVLQNIEEYNGAYIFYSLGSWIFGGSRERYDYDTAIIQITLKQKADGTFQLAGYSVVPCCASHSDKTNDFCPVPYAEGSKDYERIISKMESALDSDSSETHGT